MTAEPAAWLLLPHLRVQNANAISGPFTWGFPAPSAFTGFVHALSRKAQQKIDPAIQLEGTAIVCHDFDPQVSGRYIKSFNLTRNPVDQSGSPCAFVEEGRVHLEVSLLIGMHGEAIELATPSELVPLASRLETLAHAQRLAGGSILPTSRFQATVIQSDRDEHELRTLRRRLLPGFALVERGDRLQQHLEAMRTTDADATPLDALMDLVALHWECTTTERADGSQTVEWTPRPRIGWTVPLPVGYRAISTLYDPGTVRNARDEVTPLRFVETVYSLGEWVSPHRVHKLTDLLWHHQAQPAPGLYLCSNRQPSESASANFQGE